MWCYHITFLLIQFYKKKNPINRKGQQRAIKMIEGKEMFPYWERLKTERLLLLFGKKKNWE